MNSKQKLTLAGLTLAGFLGTNAVYAVAGTPPHFSIVANETEPAEPTTDDGDKKDDKEHKDKKKSEGSCGEGSCGSH